MNKKAQIEDFTDWLILVIGILFLMLFLQLTVIKSLDDKAKESVSLVEKSEGVNNYLTQQREELGSGNTLDSSEIDRAIYQIRYPAKSQAVVK